MNVIVIFEMIFIDSKWGSILKEVALENLLEIDSLCRNHWFDSGITRIDSFGLLKYNFCSDSSNKWLLIFYSGFIKSINAPPASSNSIKDSPEMKRKKIIRYYAFLFVLFLLIKMTIPASAFNQNPLENFVISTKLRINTENSNFDSDSSKKKIATRIIPIIKRKQRLTLKHMFLSRIPI